MGAEAGAGVRCSGGSLGLGLGLWVTLQQELGFVSRFNVFPENRGC